jgi:hypothetical protein
LSIPEGWRAAEYKNFAVALSPGKPEGATTWTDIYGRKAEWNGVAWELIEEEDEWDDDDEVPLEIHINSQGAEAREALDKFSSDDPVIKSYREMSDEELGLIRLYTMSYHKEFNDHLRGRLTTAAYTANEQRDIARGAEVMSRALESLPSSMGSQFYRGMSGEIESSRTVQSYMSLEPGDVISDRGFCSFTSSSKIPYDFMIPGGKRQNILLVGESERLKNVAPVSASPIEKEHLALPGTEFRVKSSEKVNDRMFGPVQVIKIEDYN